VAVMSRQSFRSPLGRAIGLGSAKRASRHWFAERATAVALVPLTVWFLASIVAHAGSDYTVFTAWLRTPFAAGAMVLLLVALFHHAALGLQVVIEDYVHSSARFAALIAIQLCCYGLGVIGIIAVLRVAFRS
jgi:succinate dehydrogenase / fumarate reductase membrane anchor subunit